MIYKTEYNSPLGKITLASDGKAIIGLWIEGQKYFADSVEDRMIENNSLQVFEECKMWLDKYFKGERPDINELSLAPQGNEFRQAVWRIAKRVAKITNKPKMSAQAVGGAVGHNPVSIIIPCHRVIGTSGSLTGYAGGIDIKIKLLKHECVDMSKMFVPKKSTAK